MSRLFCKMGVHRWGYPGGPCTECGTPDLFGRVGWIEDFEGECWVAGDEPFPCGMWIGPFRRLRARWWASRNCIQLVGAPR